MADFHFLRPWWLLALPIGVWLILHLLRSGTKGGRWQAFVDEALQPFVLTGTSVVIKERRNAMFAAICAWLLAIVALAGPTWERLPVPAVRSDEALVIVLDLSRSMDAVDLEPARLTQAKLKLLSLLERRESGQTGLVVFSAHAFTVAPLTSDVRTIALLVSSLSSDIMPSRGSYPEAGMTKAAGLLDQAGIPRGEILMITDSSVSPTALDIAQDIYRTGHTVHVLAVGTSDGGPIIEPGGGFLTDQSGQVVVPRVDTTSLRRLATNGGGRFATITADDRDLDYLLSLASGLNGMLENSSDESERFEIDVWRDQGLWFVLVLLPFVALAVRRGWVLTWLVCFMLPIPEVQALTWDDLWKTPDQLGQEAFEAEDHSLASALFEDPMWRAAAEFRAEEFESSSATLEGLDTPDAHYNRGNALARAGQIGSAIEAYERALELDTDHEDARFNRDLLLQQPQQNQSDSSDSEGDESQDSESGDTPQQADQESNGSDQSDPQNSGEQQEQSPSSQQALAEPEESEELPQGEMPTAEELEEWEEEQAANQWLRRVPQDPGNLLRRKFLYQYQRLGIDQDGNFVWPGDEQQPW